MSIIRFYEFELDLGAYELHRNGRVVKLERIPLDILIQLIQEQGNLVSREDIVARIWGDDVFVESEQGINTAIRKIRQALRDDPDKPRFVQTVVGRGYRFIAPVEGVDSPGDLPARVDSPVAAPGASKTSWSQRAPFRMGLAGLVVVALTSGVAGYYLQRRPQQIRSVAVLPLQNLSGHSSEEYFADGITEALISGLGRLSSLQVISRTSVMRYKGSAKTVPEIARELDVDAVIEGAVVRSGNRVRITAQLIDARHDRHLWAEDYDYELRDILTIQSDVARAIANEVRLKLTPIEQQRLTARHPVNPEALDEYLKGRSFWGQRTEPNLRKAIAHFQAAIGKDPNYAAAYSGLADTYSILGVYTYISPSEAFPTAKAAAIRALQLDDELAEAHVSMGIVMERLDWDWAGVDRHQRRALELDPGYATSHHWRSYHLEVVGRFDESIQEMALAWRLDPFSLPINTSYGAAFLYSRRYQEAEGKYHDAEELEPSFVLAHAELARVYAQTNRFDLAIAEAQKAAALSEQLPRFVAELAYVLALSGRKAEARRMLHDLSDTSMRRYISPQDLALICAGLNDHDAAFQWLDKAYAERSAWLPWLNRDPRWDTLRSDSRFSSLVHRIGLPD